MAKYPPAYKVPDHVHVPKSYGTDRTEAELLNIGFVSKDKDQWVKECKNRPSKLADPPRFTYRWGPWRALSPNHETPWWTIQRWRGSQCEWFVDFGLGVPAERVAWFIGRMES